MIEGNRTITEPEPIKAAVFGTSRSGKDYTIANAQELLMNKGMVFDHISPIKLVHDELNGGKLRGMAEDEK